MGLSSSLHPRDQGEEVHQGWTLRQRYGEDSVSYTILLIRDHHEGPVAWCGEYYDSYEQAEQNTIFGHALGARVIVEDWDASIEVPCLHGIHQHDCARCAVHRCVHLNDPARCQRCLALRASDGIRCWDCGDEHLFFCRKNKNGTYSECPECSSEITCHTIED